MPLTDRERESIAQVVRKYVSKKPNLKLDEERLKKLIITIDERSNSSPFNEWAFKSVLEQLVNLEQEKEGKLLPFIYEVMAIPTVEQLKVLLKAVDAKEYSSAKVKLESLVKLATSKDFYKYLNKYPGSGITGAKFGLRHFIDKSNYYFQRVSVNASEKIPAEYKSILYMEIIEVLVTLKSRKEFIPELHEKFKDFIENEFLVSPPRLRQFVMFRERSALSSVEFWKKVGEELIERFKKCMGQPVRVDDLAAEGEPVRKQANCAVMPQDSNQGYSLGFFPRTVTPIDSPPPTPFSQAAPTPSLDREFMLGGAFSAFSRSKVSTQHGFELHKNAQK